jgi:hypothetical protein
VCGGKFWGIGKEKAHHVEPWQPLGDTTWLIGNNGGAG